MATGALRRWTTAAAALISALMLVSGCGSKSKRPAKNAAAPVMERSTQSFLPGDLDLVARIDWKRVREQHLTDVVTGYLHAFGVPSSYLLAAASCMPRAQRLWIGMRLRNQGADGDVLLVVDGIEQSATTGECEVTGLREQSVQRNVKVLVPTQTSASLDAVALAIRTRDGLVLAGAAQADALERILRDGPDERRIEPSQQGLVTIEASVEHSRLPIELRNKAPTVFASLKGMERAKVVVELGASVQVRGVLHYGSEADAAAAGELLKKLREAILSSERGAYREAARSSHASLTDSRIQVRFEIAR